MVVSGKSPPPLCRDIVLQAMQYYVDGYLSPKELDCEDVVFNENFASVLPSSSLNAEI